MAGIRCLPRCRRPPSTGSCATDEAELLTGSFPTKTRGDDIWTATLGTDVAWYSTLLVRFVSLTDCDAKPTGIIFDKSGARLFVNVLHRGGDGLDKTVAFSRTPRKQ